jgi:hypothetical protein
MRIVPERNPEIRKPEPSLPLFDKASCQCKRSDAWRCAVSQGLQMVTCHCACHQKPIEKAHARRSDPDTSHASAAAFTEDRLTQIQRDVLDFFRSHGRATDEDIEDALSSKHPAFSTLRKRRTDLVQRGFLRDTGERRLNRNNRKMIVWEIAA